MGNFLWGKYVTEDDFGDGSLIKAVNRETGETVALKRIRAMRDEAAGELRAWRDVYPDDFRGFFTENGILYVERVWIEGETLFEHVLRKGTLDEKTALHTAQKIAEELQYFYTASGLLHGDVKPENIIVCGGGVRIIDFESSAAERHPSQAKITSRTRTLRFMTPGFSAPECARGDLTQKSDIFSLGAILLFMLTGGVARENFNGRSETAELIDRFTDSDEEKRPCSMDAAIEMIGDALPREYGGVLFKNTVFGYRRLILYVRDNMPFSTELAAVTASLGLKVGFFEFCDTGDGVAGYYFAQKFNEQTDKSDEKCGKGDFLPESGDFIAAETGPEYCTEKAQTGDADNAYGELYFETKKTGAGDFLLPDNLRDFSLGCYSDYDVTVVCDSTELSPDSRAQLMRFSDYCILTARPDADEFEEEIRRTTRFAGSYAVPLKRLRTVAWEYRDGESAEETTLRAAAGDSYLGRIEYDAQRRSSKNLSGGFYNLQIPENIRGQYADIIGEILPLTQRRA